MNEFYRALGLQSRQNIIRCLEGGGRGHLPSAFSLVEILNVLYFKILNVKPENAKWVDRDRFILSKGHGCLALYSVLCQKGFFPDTWLDTFSKFESHLGGHPGHNSIPGCEFPTGSLGHGLSAGVGMAYAAKIKEAKWRVFVVVGDGECNEGSIWESALSASKNKLQNLTCLVDYNKLQSFGKVSEVMPLEPFAKKFESFGWNCTEVDMDYPERLEEVLKNAPRDSGKPMAIICHTVKGKGISYIENNLAWHHKSKIKPEEIQGLKNALLELK